MLKFELIKPVVDKSIKSSYEVIVTTMEGDADYFYHHKLYNFEQKNANDMDWLETIVKWLIENKGKRNDNSLVMSLFFGDEMIDFDGTEMNYSDWELMPKFFKDMNREEKEREHERISKHIFYEAGWNSPYKTYWNYDEYSSRPDSLYSYRVEFVDEDKVRWDVKFDIID